MTDKKEYLKSYLLQQNKINRLNEMARLNPDSSKRYMNEIEKCKALRIKIENEISAMDDELLKEVLFLKYVCGKNLEEVSYFINYSKRQTERFHKAALEKFKTEK